MGAALPTGGVQTSAGARFVTKPCDSCQQADVPVATRVENVEGDCLSCPQSSSLALESADRYAVAKTAHSCCENPTVQFQEFFPVEVLSVMLLSTKIIKTSCQGRNMANFG